jgi:NYN domain
MTRTKTASSTPQGSKAAPRRIVLVDVENVVGGLSAMRDLALSAKEAVEECISARPGDQVVLGVSPAGLLNLACAWTRVRYVMRSGLDGADLVLLDVLGENIADRFAEVVLVSGDGIFTNAVAKLASQGVHTTVVAHRAGLSRRLELAANEVRFLPDRLTPVSAHAVPNTDVA